MTGWNLHLLHTSDKRPTEAVGALRNTELSGTHVLPRMFVPLHLPRTKVRFSRLYPMLLIQNLTPARLADEKSLRVIKECNTFAASSWDASGLWLRCSLLSWSSLMDDELPETAPLRSLLGAYPSSSALVRIQNGFGIPLMPEELLRKFFIKWNPCELHRFLICLFVLIADKNNIFRLN